MKKEYSVVESFVKLILILAFVCLVSYGSYQFYYYITYRGTMRSMVQETVREMVKEDALKDQ